VGLTTDALESLQLSARSLLVRAVETLNAADVASAVSILHDLRVGYTAHRRGCTPHLTVASIASAVPSDRS